MQVNRDHATVARRPWGWFGSGAIVLGVGLYGLVEDVPILNVAWYAFGWYGYLVILHGITLRLGCSPDGHDPAWRWFLWSIPFWYLFEIYNVRIQNWHYVYTFRDDTVSLVYAFVAFATVLPACFFHQRLVGAVWPWGHLRWRPIAPGRGWIQVAWGLGAACVILPVMYPRSCFWMVWGALLGIPEALAYRVGARSMLRDLEQGRPARFLHLLVGGMMAGIVWEGMNYWARCKWIYTVPGMETWKLFEMPILGFLGFPVLALNAHSTYALIGWYWSRQSIIAKSALAAAALVVSLYGHHVMVTSSVRSYRPLISEFSPDVESRVREAGYSSVEALADACRSSEETVNGLEDACRIALLAQHKGMGIPNASMLYDSGIRGPEDLTSVDEIYTRVAGKDSALRRAEAAVWVRAADGGYRR